MSLALCPQVVSQAPQHFRPFETQANYDGCFARQSICSVSSLHSGTARLGHYVHRSLRRCMSNIDTIMQSGLSTLTRPEAHCPLFCFALVAFRQTLFVRFIGFRHIVRLLAIGPSPSESESQYLLSRYKFTETFVLRCTVGN